MDPHAPPTAMPPVLPSYVSYCASSAHRVSLLPLADIIIAVCEGHLNDLPLSDPGR